MSDDASRVAMGSRIRESRLYLALSQEEVATILGIPRSAVSQIEAGQRGLDALELKKLAEVLGRSADFLTSGDASDAVDERVALLARAAKGLSQTDLGELQRFAAFLRARSDTPKS